MPMPGSVKRNLRPACGAGKHNKYKHDQNCLFNLPSHTTTLVEWWTIGRNEKVASGNPSIYTKLDGPEDKAYMAGYNCPRPVYATV